ncbi:hypothetical protein FNV43_RR12804 [Rhamnella rubrinervis]|uniref:Filament-like plant protein n=1 Tax=Rhamnella rubrinervis TaxID=2594499 RepID=A0A8K0H804_9ROSA|nr:hypothetical protein FNV43_RR12804 [Rhamnella rubrinervis]
MEKRKWLWKRRSSERSPGETESSGSISSHSERYSDDQEALKGSPDHNSQSAEVSSKAVADAESDESSLRKENVNDSVKSLTERLSAALVNISAKEDLVKQHAKVAEEAVAGWEKAENEVSVLKQQLEAAVQQNLALEDRVSHLDGALKECVRQLRQAREEQEQKVHEVVLKKTCDWESTKLKLESQLLELQNQVEANKSEFSANVDPDIFLKLENLEKENSDLKLEIQYQAEELEVRTIERDLSAQAAETASKQHLESIKKVAKLEAECRRLKAMNCKSSLGNDHKSTAASSTYAESFLDSHSDSGERLNGIDINSHKITSSELNKCEKGFSDSWASALIAELDQFKNEKAVNRNLPASSVEINLMDDFLEMERLAASQQTESGSNCLESKVVNQPNNGESALRNQLEAMIQQTAELEEQVKKLETEKAELGCELEEKVKNWETDKTELATMIHRTTELEEKIEKLESEKAELETALTKSQESIEASKLQLAEAEKKMEGLQSELNIAKETKQVIESHLICMEAEARIMSAKVDLLEEEVQKEKAMSAEIAVRCRNLEEEVSREKEEVKLRQTASSNTEMKIKQEDLAVAAGKLAECQKTIASLGNQLKSLATLEDFLIDTANLPEFSTGTSVLPKSGEEWRLHSNETFSPKRDSESSKPPDDSCVQTQSKNDGNSPPSLSSSTSSAVILTHVCSEKNRNGFAKFFSRTKSGIRLEI